MVRGSRKKVTVGGRIGMCNRYKEIIGVIRIVLVVFCSYIEIIFSKNITMQKFVCIILQNNQYTSAKIYI